MIPDLAWWGRLLGLLATEAALLVAVAALVARLVRAPQLRRLVWQSAFLAVALVWTVELAGGRSWLTRWQEPLPLKRQLTARVVGSEPVVAEEVAFEFPVEAVASVPAPAPQPNWWPGLLWLTGLGALTVRALGTRAWLAWRFRSRHRQKAPISSEFRIQNSEFERSLVTLAATESVVARLRQQLGLRCVRIQVWPQLRGPVAFGIFRPTVAVPADFETRFTPVQREAMLAHELAHLANRDPLWLLVAELVCALAWWHPAVWWAGRQFRAACEAAADEASTLVPGGRLALAEALLNFGRELTAPGGVGVAGSGLKSELARRVKELVEHTSDGMAVCPGRVWLVRGGLVTLLGTLLFGPLPGYRDGLRPVLAMARAEASKSSSSEGPRTKIADVLAKPESRETVRALASQPNRAGTESEPDSTRAAAAAAVRRPGQIETLPASQALEDVGGRDVLALLESERLLLGTPVFSPRPPNRLSVTGVPDGQSGPRRLFEGLRFNPVALAGGLGGWTNHGDRTDYQIEDLPRHVTTYESPRESLHTIGTRQGPSLPFARLAYGGSEASTLTKELVNRELEKLVEGKGTLLTTIEVSDPAPPWVSHSQEAGIQRTVAPGGLEGQRAALRLLETEFAKAARRAASATGADRNALLLIAEDWRDKRDFEASYVAEAEKRLASKADASGAALQIPLITRQFRVDPAKFSSRVLNGFRAPAESPQRQPSLIEAILDYFRKRGVEFAAIDPDASDATDQLSSPKSQTVVFYKPDPGLLFVRATLADMEMVERALDRLGPVVEATVDQGPQVQLAVFFAEITEGSSDDIGLDWVFGQARTNNPAVQSGLVTNLPAATTPLNGDRLRVDRLAVAGQSAVLSAEQFTALKERLEGRDGVDFLTAPKVTTLSGRQAQVSVGEVRTLVTGVMAKDGSPTNDASVSYVTDQVSVGPLVDLFPAAEGTGWRVKVVASVTEFLGYDEPGATNRVQAQTLGGKPLKGTAPLPRLRVRETQAEALAHGGETIALRGPLADEVIRFKDKVPVLGDVPLLGRLFRSEGTQTRHRRLYVFIQPVSIDAFGNQQPATENK